MEEVVRQFCTFSENWSDSCGTALRLISLSRILLTRALRLAPKRPRTVSTSTFNADASLNHRTTIRDQLLSGRGKRNKQTNYQFRACVQLPPYLMNMSQQVTTNFRRCRLRSAVRGDRIVPLTRTVHAAEPSYRRSGRRRSGITSAGRCLYARI